MRSTSNNVLQKGGMDVDKCNAVRDMIVPYIENELDQDLRNQVEEHIEQCELCRTELYDIKQVMELCAGMPQEELPEDFHSQLHEKLVGISAGQNASASLKKSRLAFINSRYLKICSSIAAALILAVLLRGLFPYTKTHDQSEPLNMRQFSSSGSVGSEADLENDAGMAMLPDSSLYGAENGEIIISEKQEKESGSGDTGSYKQDKPVQAPAKKKENQSSIDKHTPKSTVEHEKTQRSLKEDRGAGQEDKKEACLQGVDLILKVDDPESGREEARTYIADFGGKLTEAEASGEQDMSGFAEPAEAGGPAEVIGSGKLAFEMPKVQYSGFIEKLGNAFGQDSLVVGESKSVDVKDRLDSLQDQLSGLNEKKASAHEEMVPEEAVKTEEEIGYVQWELDNLKHSLENISVVLSVEKKGAAGDASGDKEIQAPDSP
ncbi:putative zinc finger protein [Anaerobacterium chartisolvens]|uniref:Anti-sigma-W factor RsiW n=1 Tax=Anaerobacterium chartisolvens TaxID=1297424 RepID=A0A369B4V5_9FIRM|nr:zf-HC2 domain-containing protein [Anaerobacterium chartisolvens]RCX16523.1 putative zinc finger protein [Anaerobacterium chartisolvens]